MVTRFILVPRKLLASLHHPVEGLFCGTYFVSVALILNCTHIYGNGKTGAWLAKALEVCFWIYCAIAFIVGVVQYSLFFRLERLNVTNAVPAWIFPVYPLLVVGTLAGTILPAQPEQASWEIFVGGVILQGLAWVVSFLMYGIYMQRLMTSALPHPTVRPGMYVSVGPAGTLCPLFFPSSFLTLCRVHCRRTHLSRQSSTYFHPTKFLDKHGRSRRRSSPHYRHHVWSFYYSFRVLVLRHHHGCHYGWSAQDVLFIELVGVYLPKRWTCACNHSSCQSTKK